MFIVGTSGHVDHGKTALVKALTGIDTDRLPEEKKRSLTIDLGFASFTGQDGKPIGVIDVPGHERFIRNMVSGAWALQCALLLVAADDGWMKQTEEHARVLKGMGTPAVLLVITKIDLVESHQLEKVLREAMSRCQQLFGRSLEYCLVDAIHNKGIEELKLKIFNHLKIYLDSRPFPNCLYVDRVFSLQGTGTVVTGSLVGGSIREGDEVLLLPEGKGARVRSIQSHGCKMTTANPVSRVAITLQGLKPEFFQRGSVITSSTEFFVDNNIIGLLFSINKENGPLIRNHQEVEIAYGTRHTTATLHLVKGEGILDENPTQIVRMVLHEKSSCFWNQSFICMRPGGSEIICTGNFIWQGKLANREIRKLAQIIQKHAGIPPGISLKEHLELAMLGQADMRMPVSGSFILLGQKFIGIGSRYIEETQLLKCKEEILDKASKLGGITFEELKASSEIPDNCVAYCIQQLIDEKTLFTNKQILTTIGPQQKELSLEEKRFLVRIQNAGFQGVESKQLSKEDRLLLRALTREGHTIVLDGLLIYSLETYKMMTQKVLFGKNKGDLFSIADAKANLALSRKYIIPLLNKMEEDKLVERIGDSRRVL